MPPPPDAKWRHPCTASASERLPGQLAGLPAATHVDVYLCELQRLSVQLLPLLQALHALPRVNCGAFGPGRACAFDLPGLAPPGVPPRPARGLSAALLQHWDQAMARAAVYLQLSRSFVRRNSLQEAPRSMLDRALSLVLRCQCRVQLLQAARFGPRSWPSRSLTVGAVVPPRWRASAPQAVQHLRNFVTARRLQTAFRSFAATCAALRATLTP